MAEKCINCISASPTPPQTNPMEWGPGNTFSAQNRKKNQKIHDFQPKKGGVIVSTFLTPSPPPDTSLKSSQQRVSSEGGEGVWGLRTKNALGMRLLDKK